MRLFTKSISLALIGAMLLTGPLCMADVESGLAALKIQDPDTAFQEFREADKAGDAEGTFYLGLAYLNGWGVPADVGHGTDLVRDAAETGLAIAEYEMAVAYRYGRGVERNYETSFSWFQRAARQDNPSAQMMLGYSYRDGVGVAVDGSKAVHYFNLAADSDPKALMEIGAMYYAGKAVPQDFTKAVAMFRAGADRDHPHSVYWLSYLYKSGEGLPFDTEKHLEFLERSANLGSGRAQHEMGMKSVFPFGDDPVKAVYWFEKAALSGHKDALEELTFVLEQANWEIATEKGRAFWIQKAAESGIAQQQWNYAKLLDRGDEVKQDREAARKYLLAAAEGGFKSAQFLVGQAYYEGALGLPVDQNKGHELIRGAALQSSPEAMKAMAVIYSSGAGANEDAFVAYMWLLYAEREGAKGLDSLRGHLLPRLDGGLMHTAKSRLEDCTNLEHCTRPYNPY